MKDQWIVVVLGSLTGCWFSSTPYQPRGPTGGYTDYPAGRGVHYVGFAGNGYTSKAAVTQMWHRRASEICGGPNRYEIVSRDGSTSESFYVANGRLHTVDKHDAEGYIHCVDASGNIVEAPPPAPRPAPTAQAEDVSDPAWVDPAARQSEDSGANPSQRRRDCEMRDGKRYCH